MKKLSTLFVLLILITSCKERKIDSTNTTNKSTYTILDGACGTIVFNSKPHDNLEASIKALENENKAMLPKNHKIEKRPFKIDFKKDNRDFYGISFVNQSGIHETLALSHVVDTKGTIYNINWCED